MEKKKIRIKRPYRSFALMAFYVLFFTCLIIFGHGAPAGASGISFPVWCNVLWGYVYILGSVAFFAKAED